MLGEVLADERDAQTGDEPAQVVPLQVAEQARAAVEQRADAVDLRELLVEALAEGPYGGPVGVGRFLAQGDQQVQVAAPHARGAARDRSVEVGAVQARAEHGRQPVADGGHHRGERGPHAREGAFADQPTPAVEALGGGEHGHGATVPSTAAPRGRISARAGGPAPVMTTGAGFREAGPRVVRSP